MVAFGIPEYISASNNQDGDTFSESLSWIVSLSPLIAVGFLSFLAAFAYHITLGEGKRWWPGQKKKEAEEEDGEDSIN